MTSSAKMSNYVYHHKVHEWLKEKLHFFILGIPNFRGHQTMKELMALFEKNHFSSVRSYMIFGPYDVLVRAWLHPIAYTRFEQLLIEFGSQDKVRSEFSVQSIHLKPYSNDPKSRSQEPKLAILEREDESFFWDVPEAEDKLSACESNHLLLKLDTVDSAEVSFFIAISVPNATDNTIASITSRLAQHLDGQALIRKPSIYSGVGFCQIFLKAKVRGEYFQEIGGLTEWIRSEFQMVNASTETHIVARKAQARNESISLWTFLGIEGTDDKRIDWLPPEVLFDYNPISRDIRSFLKAQSDLRRLTHKDKERLGHYFRAIKDQNTEAAVEAVSSWFSNLETTLRKDLPKFATKVNVDPSELLLQSGLEGKQVSEMYLNELLALFRKLFERIDTPKDDYLPANLDQLRRVRNAVQHGRKETQDLFSHRWQDTSKDIITWMARIRALSDFIEDRQHLRKRTAGGGT